MKPVLLVANLNCDHALSLQQALASGGRHQYQDSGRRLGGGAANTGLGLVWAGYKVELVTQLGSDATADWLLEQAQANQLSPYQLIRHPGAHGELLLLLEPNGERSIIRPQRPEFTLPSPPDFSRWGAVYFNSLAVNQRHWSEAALTQTQVVCQYIAHKSPSPCHYLIASASDLPEMAEDELWSFARQYAGEHLKGFVLTCGSKGAIWFDGNTQVCQPALACDVLDTTGAGDAFVGGFIHALLAEKNRQQILLEACQWACCALQTASSIPGDALRNHLKL
ncbi:PfkB family carbohydrate kinase [Paraferrimonas sedimenticola]|uniref:Ribokinase n=1 Tax=Paraferrimonas sedimenticola TaxID=375674 RepID=A0AA37RYK9_9GAMM|nr:PfkB family carbohydrate kinase [Paraferrimonas sedimenticola]GLP97561.1 ribokinase [Paraferrimonas sedimenticola]